jgi:hypothetical protein
MKGSVDAPPIHNILGVVGVMVAVGILLLWTLCRSRKNGVVEDALRDLRSNSAVVVDDAGETSTERLYDISISAIREHFDLNLIYGPLQEAGCRLLSTADANHPNHRTLSLAIPKRPASAPNMAYATALFGVCAAVLVFNVPVLYNSFEQVWERVDGFLDAQAQSLGGDL